MCELEFGWFGDAAVCCELAQEGGGTVVLFEQAWLGVPLDLGLDLVISWEWGWFVAGHWSTLWGSLGLYSVFHTEDSTCFRFRVGANKRTAPYYIT